MRAVVGVLVAVALAAGSATAQQVDTVTLTLADALTIAEGSNPGYRRAANDVGLNGVEMQTRWMDQLLPRVSLQLFSTQFTGNRRLLGVNTIGEPIEGSGEWRYYSNSTQQLNLQWNVQGVSLFQAHRRQTLDNTTRDLTESRVRSELQVDVRRLFWDAQEQRELVRTEQELVDSRVVDLALTERLFGLAQRTRVDVLNAELDVERQRLLLQQQRAAYENALLSLRTELGDDELPPVRLSEDEDLPIFDPSSLDADALVRSAHAANPQLRESRSTVDGAELGVREAENTWWPQLALGFTVWRQSQDPDGADALFDPSPGTGFESNLYAQLSLPAFNNYFRNRQARYQASVQLENSQETERETRLHIDQTVHSELLALRNQWESLRITERSLAIAEEALALRREEYRLGAATFEELRQSIDAEAEQRRQLVTARHAFVDALLNLEAAVGTEVRN